MALLEEWQKIAYDQQADRGKLQKFWQRYFMLEKGVYEKLLTNPDEKVEGTVKELAEKYDLSIMDMTGFLDGINDSLVTPNPIDTMEEDTKVSLAFDKEKLYKNMVDAKLLFANLSDIHELDDVSYLTDYQKAMIKKFFSNFSDDHNTELKKRFLQLWSHFYDIYVGFNQKLAEQKLAYEGALYRKVVNDEDIDFHYKKYLFIGFNMMQIVEQTLCDRLLKQGKALFYWDYDKYYMEGQNEAGHYIRQYLKHYPNELASYPQKDIYDNMSKNKDITYISAPTENIQARYVNAWLKEHNRYKMGRNVAIVLSDENLLQSVIHSLPEEVKSVNITIGYPLQQTPFYSLIQQLIQLQGIGHPQHSETYRLHYVLTALRHPYTRFISSRYADLLEKLEEQKRFYPSRDFLSMDGDEGLSLLFRNLEEQTAEATQSSYNKQLISYLLDILRMIGTQAKDLNDPLFHESLYRTYTLLNRLQELITSGDLEVDTITLERLIQQLIQTTSIPFHGEPAEGIQVMGVLETRNLDFDHILVLSCNEGKIPKGVNDSSFIPYSLRKAYGLTTVENKVAIFAYYFHSMLQRAHDITLTYNNATEDGQSGEMSRFMLQLMVESQHPIVRKTLIAGQKPLRPAYDEEPKTEEVMKVLDDVRMLTPTFLNTYQRCQKQFYYKYVKGLLEPDEIDEDEVDNRIFGNIFHRAAELFYYGFASKSDIQTDEKGKQQLICPIVITADILDQAMKDKMLVDRLVDQAFREELFKVGNNDYHPKYNGLQLINKEVIASYLRQLISIDRRQTPFTIIGMELVVSDTLNVNTSRGEKQFKIGGFIDRLDAISPISNISERIRVIDYKTGRAQTTHPKDIDEMFSATPQALSKHTDYYLQAFLYSMIIKNSKRYNSAQDPVSPGLLFIQNAGAEDYDPTLKLGREKIEDITPYEEDFMAHLRNLIADIYNPALPLRPTCDKKRCEYCPYAGLCK